jgi:hydrogenase nickel incorporation protein HypA/HybF
MHELSLSYATVESALESIGGLDAGRVVSITLSIGAFSGVAVDAFRFSFPLAAAGTLLENAELRIEEEPVSVYCGRCEAVCELRSIRDFRCPRCGEPTADVRGGTELLIQSIEVETNEYSHSGIA